MQFLQKTEWTCGPAVLSRILNDPKMDEDTIARIIGTNPENGTPIRAFSEFASKRGIEFLEKSNSNLKVIESLLDDGWKVVVCYRMMREDEGHYAIIEAIDNEVHIWDPENGHRSLLVDGFLKRWSLGPKGEPIGKWLFGMRVGLTDTSSESSSSDADLVQRQ